MDRRYRHSGNESFNLEYIRYPIAVAFQSLQNDLSQVENTRQLRMVTKRWRLAERKFKTDMSRLPIMLYSPPGNVARLDEYNIYLRRALELIVRKEKSLITFKV